VYNLPGSSVWVITFTCSFYLILQTTLYRQKMSGAASLLLTGLLSTPLMCLQMAILQFIAREDQGLPTRRSLIIVLILYSSVIMEGFGRKLAKTDRVKIVNYVLLGSLAIYYTFLTLNMSFGSPESHLSTGVHQEVGDCNIEAPDITGHLRQVYLCKEKHTQDFTFDCSDLCKNKDVNCKAVSNSWYTICGRPHSDYALWLTTTGVLCVIGVILFTYTLTYRSGERRQQKQKVK